MPAAVFRYSKRKDFNRAIWWRVKVVKTVLDIGCGIRPQTFFKPDIHYCVEPCLEYIEILRRKYKRRQLRLIPFRVQDVFPAFTEDSGVDTIFLLDVLEHMPKHEGAAVLKWALGIAHQQVIVSTPLGFREQKDFEKDAWGLKGKQWQQHFSGWVPENFTADGWEVLICENYSYMDVGKVYDKPIGILWAVWNNPVSSPVRQYAIPGFITRLQITDRIVPFWSWVLRLLPPALSTQALALSLKISINADQLLRRWRLS